MRTNQRGRRSAASRPIDGPDGSSLVSGAPAVTRLAWALTALSALLLLLAVVLLVLNRDLGVRALTPHLVVVPGFAVVLVGTRGLISPLIKLIPSRRTESRQGDSHLPARPSANPRQHPGGTLGHIWSPCADPLGPCHLVTPTPANPASTSNWTTTPLANRPA
jgi:hypothetical protein